jgi:hypothetical protein
MLRWDFGKDNAALQSPPKDPKTPRQLSPVVMAEKGEQNGGAKQPNGNVQRVPRLSLKLFTVQKLPSLRYRPKHEPLARIDGPRMLLEGKILSNSGTAICEQLIGQDYVAVECTCDSWPPGGLAGAQPQRSNRAPREVRSSRGFHGGVPGSSNPGKSPGGQSIRPR